MSDGIDLRCADCLGPDGVPSLADRSAALVTCDPPYNIGKADWDNMDPAAFLRWQRALLRECWRILMPGGALYWFCSQWWMVRIERLILRVGFTIQNRIVWAYDNCQRHARTRFPMGWEPIFFATKGDRPRVMGEVRDGVTWARTRYKRNPSGSVSVNRPHPDGRRITDVWWAARLAGAQGAAIAHESPKPTELYRRMILASTEPGDLVVSPCLGSGPEVEVCHGLGRRLIGFDRNPAYVELAKNRLRQQRLVL